jgi:DNA-binding CsgD family transcriptional regulator
MVAPMRAAVDAGLIEREAPLAALTRALEGAARGEGSVAVVSGPAGIGKTSLITAVRDDAAARGLRLLHARGTELERAFTFGVVRSLIEGPLRRMSARERELRLQGAAAPAAVALGLHDSAGATVDASPALLNAIYWVIADLCDDAPLVLAVDDLHWADPPSLRALAFLTNRVEGLALTLIVGVRDGASCDDPDALAALRRSPAAVAVALDALSPGAVGELVTRRCGEALDDATVQALHRATAGNPLWASQAAAILADSGTSASLEDQQAWSSRALTAVVVGRLRRMSAAAQEIAWAVAVLGDGTAPRHIADLAGLSAEEVLVAAGELARSGLLDQGSAIAFAHPLMRDAVLSAAGEHDLSLAHRRAAAILRASGAPVERVAGHVLRTVADADPQNVADLLAAATDALRRGSPVAALGYIERAALEPPDSATQPVVEMMQGLAEFKLGHFADAARHLAAPAHADDADVDVVFAHGAALAWSGEADDTLMRSSFEAAARQSDPEHQLMLIAGASIAAWFLPKRWVPAIELPAPDSLAGLSSGERAALSAHALHLSDAGDLNYAADVAERCLGDGRMLAERPSLVVAVLGPLWVLLWAGRVDAFDREAAHVEELARATASSEPTHVLNMARIMRHVLSGDLPAALATHDTMQRFASGIPGAENHTVAHLAMASHLEALLAHAGAQAADAELTAFVAKTDLSVRPAYLAKWVLATRSLVHLACGRTAQALIDAEVHAEFVRDHGGCALPVSWPTALPLARLAAGDRPGALEAAQDLMAREQIHAVPQRIAAALRVLAHVDSARAVELLTEAVEMHAGGTMRLEHATAQIDLGVALRRAGKRAAARGVLERGADIATACQATVLAQRAREELNILGAKPRRLAFSGIASLTASERRIADLAAKGPTNREIAQQLYLTRKTVECHLSSVYRKLDITSREQLAGVLAASSLE